MPRSRRSLAASGIAVASRFDQVAAQFAGYRDRLADAVPLLRSAEPWSLFVPATHEAHYAALRRLVDTASTTPR